MACECLKKMQEKGAEYNTRLVEGMVFGTAEKPGYSKPTLMTEKINTRNRQKVGFAMTFCPFCGTRYEPEIKADEVTSGAA
jgi:hypothetical protein